MFQIPCFIWIITLTLHLTDEDTEAAGSGVIGGSKKLSWVFSSRACACNCFAIVPFMSYSNDIFGTGNACSFSTGD